MKIAFGTEGWRAIIAQEFTMDNVALVTQAIADHFRASGRRGSAPTVAVGYDTRFLSDRFAQVVAEVLAGNGIRVRLADRFVPTCAVSRYVVAHRLTCGVMITASHNPAAYNGIKIKEAFGGSATTETVASVERHLGRHPAKRVALEQATRQGLVDSVNMLPDFLNGIRRFINLAAIRRSGLRVLVDPMHGAGGRLIEQLVAGGPANSRAGKRCTVRTLHANPDPLFGGQAPEPIASHLTELSRALARGRWSLGLATDGDADRLGVLGPDGAFIPPGQILCVVLDYLLTVRHWKGAVVKTISNTSMINRFAHDRGLILHEVPVGFKHIAKLMIEDHVLIGGEESGGIGVQGYLPERDGILMGLLVLEAMAVQGQGMKQMLRRLERRYGRWHYGRNDLHVPMERVQQFFDRVSARPPSAMAGIDVAEVKRLDGIKLIGRDESWLLFRRSGTEPIVRVYAESLAASRGARLLAFGETLIQTA